MNRLSGFLGIAPAKEAGARARAAVKKALELDDALGEAYALSGAYRAWLDFDWRGAEADFDRAAALSPAAVNTHWLRTMVLLPHNRMEEAVQEMEHAIELDPLSPLLHGLFAWLLAFKRDFDRAPAESETALTLAPEHPGALAFRGSALYETQRRAYIIADNKLALNAGWDEDALAAELRDLECEAVDRIGDHRGTSLADSVNHF